MTIVIIIPIVYNIQHEGGMITLTDLLTPLTTELRRGTLTLAVLSQLNTPQYGYSLVQLLEKSGIMIDQSTLYPLLRRLEKQKLVTSIWDTEQSRPRKYYQISNYGIDIYCQLKAEWEKMNEELRALLEGNEQYGSD